MTTLSISAEKAIRAHGEATYPHECCGFLFGSEQADQRDISHYLEVENSQVENRERRFLVSTDDYKNAEAHAEKNGLQLLGIYHSHPDHPAIPSETDRMQAMPFFSYIIVAVAKGTSQELTSWTLNTDFQFEEEELTLREEILKEL